MEVREDDGLDASVRLISPDLVPEATTGFQLPMTNNHYGSLYNTWYTYYCTGESPAGAYHPGIDFNGPGGCDDDRNTDILSVANGTVVWVDGSSWGSLVIQHLWQGQTWYSQYGHLDAVLVSVGQNVVKGQHVGEMGDVGTDCAHLHWEIREADHPNPGYGPYWTCSVLRNSTLVENYYENPETFVSSHGPYGGYHCTWHSQSPSTWFWTKPGNIHTFWVKYTNSGTATWTNSGGVGVSSYVELWSCNSSGNIVNSWFVPVGWVNVQRVTSCNEASVAPGGVATFSFQAQIPAASSGDVLVYFRPTHGGQVMDDWGGMHYPIHVDANNPTVPGNVAASPPSNNTNSFAFSWSASSDAHSGVYGYYWKVNDDEESFTGSTSVPTGAYATLTGTNTFSVRCRDNVGNYSSYASVSFNYEPGGCGPPMTSCGAAKEEWQSLSGGAKYEDWVITLNQRPTEDWAAIGQKIAGFIEADKWYRIGFWYRTQSTAPFGWGLAPESGVKPANIMQSTVIEYPIPDGEWHQYWSAPFLVTNQQLQDLPVMVFYMEDGAKGSVEINDVELFPGDVPEQE